MSQLQYFNTGGTPGFPNVEFLQGNDNVPVGPNPATHVIDVIGDITKGVSVTNTAPYTEQVSVAFATYSTPGVSSYNVTNFTVAAGVVSSNNIDIIAGTGLTGGGLVTLGGSVTLNATATGPDLHAARYIVSAGGTADGANYTTIGSAITAAALAGAPQTIIIQPGVYVEDPVMQSGINLCAFTCDSFTDFTTESPPSNVIINGKVQASYSGQASISGICFETNSDYSIAVTGSSGTILNLTDCYLDATNHSAILNSSSGGSITNLFHCNGDLGATGTYFNNTGNGVIRFFGGYYQNTGGSTIASTNSSSSGVDVSFYDVSLFGSPITTSNDGILSSNNSNFGGPIIVNNTVGTNVINHAQISSASNSAITIGAGTTIEVSNTTIDSSNTNAITGAGTLNYGLITFTGSSSTVNVTTQNPLPTLPNIGNVNGPVSAVNGNFASFNGTSGKVIQDSGVSSASFLQVSNNLSDVGSQPTALNNLMPPTPAKGTIAVFNGTNWANLPVGTNTQVLTANSGATNGVDWETGGGGSGFTSINIQAFNTSGTYTPTTGMAYCIVEIVGGGGGGGGATATGAGDASLGSGGGAGEFARATFSAATIGASQTVTVGAAGAANSGAAGGNGGNSSLGALISANGGTGGLTLPSTNIGGVQGSAGGSGGSGGTFDSPGQSGQAGQTNPGGGALWSGGGGSGPYGAGGADIVSTTYPITETYPGNNALGFGAGGGGAINGPSQSAQPGGSGASGYVLITEYIS